MYDFDYSGIMDKDQKPGRLAARWIELHLFEIFSFYLEYLSFYLEYFLLFRIVFLFEQGKHIFQKACQKTKKTT
jgi:hypothetical protein